MDGEKFYVMSDEMDTHVGIVRHNLMAMLTGDVKQVEELLGLYGNNPIPIATINREGVETQVNSYLFSHVLYDAFRYEEKYDLFGPRHVQELLDLHQRVCPPTPRPDYSQFDFLTYRGEIYSIDDDNEIEMVLKDGASRQDIDLTNYGMIYKEDEMIRLLRSGASPYFLDKRYFDDEDCDCYYSYKEVAPLQSFHEMVISDQWKLDGFDSIILDEASLPKTKRLENILLGIFEIAASYRILYLVDKYITPEAHKKGEELMKEYCEYIYPILRHNSKEQ